jgi:hypothetical protein
MIHLERIRTKDAIPASFRGEKRIEKALTLLVDAGTRREFDSDYWKKVKDQLKRESGNKCAYCEAPTAVVAHGDVEHFRPKAVYWWLAYCYDNYLYACQICNQIYKGDNFPLADDRTRMVAAALAPGGDIKARRNYLLGLFPDPLEDIRGLKRTDFEAACRAERALLLNPYLDDPGRHFAWEADDVLREVRVVPKGKASGKYCKAAEDYYGLNRAELLTERWRTYRELKTFCRVYQSPGTEVEVREETAGILNEMTTASAPFAGMCHFFLARWKIKLEPSPGSGRVVVEKTPARSSRRHPA